MNKLQLELSTRGKKINMNLNTENESTIELAVLQSFAFMGVADPFATSSVPMIDAEPTVIEEVKEEKIEKPEKVDEIKAVEEEPKVIEKVVPEKEEPVVSSRPRAVALISDSDGVLAYSTKEEEEEKPRAYTGTKLFNGVTKYQTRYECPTCGNKGKRYLALNEHIAYCHECNQGIKKESVGKNGRLEQDDFGNFFIAKHGIL